LRSLTIAIATSALALAACRPARNPLVLAPLAELQSDFNRDSARTRVILLISPT